MDALFSRTRQGVLGVLFVENDRWWYISDLARRLGTTSSSLQRELAQLKAAGLLLFRRDGNRAYFKADPSSVLFPELRRMFEKTWGTGKVVRSEILEKYEGKIVAAFVFGSTARGEIDNMSDIDLFVVGDVTNFELTPGIRKAEKQLGREVNVHVLTADEFAQQVKKGNHFVLSVLEAEKLFVIGGPDDVEIAAGRGKRATPHAQRA